jgi:asparagine synthase (glutamine-hydrolysing)
MPNHQPSAVNFKTIVQALEASVRRNLSDSLLLSGGLDTSILAALAVRWRKPYCLTLALKGAPNPDIEYAVKVARLFDLQHSVHYIERDEMERGIEDCIRILKSFDPMEIRNSAACYVGLKTVKTLGYSSVMTGDGGDELFAGYSFFFDKTGEELDQALKNLWATMSFSAAPMGQDLGISVHMPVLDPEFQSLAKNLDPLLKIGQREGKTYGKFILRQAFENLLTPEIVWREKAPLETGTGTASLPEYYENLVPDSYFNQQKTAFLQTDKVRLRSKEHLHYYEIFRKFYGIPGSGHTDGIKCPECGGGLKKYVTFCRLCGAYPVGEDIKKSQEPV